MNTSSLRGQQFPFCMLYAAFIISLRPKRNIICKSFIFPLRKRDVISYASSACFFFSFIGFTFASTARLPQIMEHYRIVRATDKCNKMYFFSTYHIPKEIKRSYEFINARIVHSYVLHRTSFFANVNLYLWED